MKTSKKYLLIGCGTALGALVRWLCEKTVGQLTTDNTAILLVNVLGCFFIAFLTALFVRKYLSESVKIFFVTGFCGGLTTFSSFVLGMEKLLANQDYVSVALYIVFNLVLSMLAVLLGMKMGLTLFHLQDKKDVLGEK